MSAVSNSVMPRSIALWITLREVSRSQRWPKLLQPRPTAETRRPEPPRLRICMGQSCETRALEMDGTLARRSWRRKLRPYRADHAEFTLMLLVRDKKMRPRSDAATDGDRLWRVICDGGPDQTRAEASPVLLRTNDRGTYPQAGWARLLAFQPLTRRAHKPGEGGGCRARGRSRYSAGRKCRARLRSPPPRRSD